MSFVANFGTKGRHPRKLSKSFLLITPRNKVSRLKTRPITYPHLVSDPPLSWSWPLRCSEICWPLHWRRPGWGPWRGPLWPAWWPGLTSWWSSLEVCVHQRNVTCFSYDWSLFTVQYCHFWMFYKLTARTLPSGFYHQIWSRPWPNVQSLLYLCLRFKTGFLKHEQLLSDAQQKWWWLISSMTYGFNTAAKTAAAGGYLTLFSLVQGRREPWLKALYLLF